MALKIILDANVLLDLALKRISGYDDAKTIFDSIINAKFRCFATTYIVHICAHWITKYAGTKAAKDILISLLDDIDIIDASHQTVQKALNSTLLDIEDALQYFTAIENNLDCFITADKKLIKAALPILPIYHPLDFITRYID